MARGYIRKPSFRKIVGAYRSQWKRAVMRFFFPLYGRKGMGWWHNPKKAAYDWWYRRTSVSAYDLGAFPRRRPSKAFMGLVLGIGFLCSLFTLPIDLIRACRKAIKIKRARKKRGYGTRAQPKGKSDRTSHAERKKGMDGAASRQQAVPEESSVDAPYKASVHDEPLTAEEAKDTGAPDESTPKSQPKHKGDQYIRKRMVIAGSSYCAPTVIGRLTVGTYLDLVADPENPYDKNAVMLTVEGEKVGYIPKGDVLPFVTALKLGRKLYGVITDICRSSTAVQYEFETWFERH